VTDVTDADAVSRLIDELEPLGVDPIDVNVYHPQPNGAAVTRGTVVVDVLCRINLARIITAVAVVIAFFGLTLAVVLGAFGGHTEHIRPVLERTVARSRRSELEDCGSGDFETVCSMRFSSRRN
jgi:hypothetical protein